MVAVVGRTNQHRRQLFLANKIKKRNPTGSQRCHRNGVWIETKPVGDSVALALESDAADATDAIRRRGGISSNRIGKSSTPMKPTADRMNECGRRQHSAAATAATAR